MSAPAHGYHRASWRVLLGGWVMCAAATSGGDDSVHTEVIERLKQLQLVQGQFEQRKVMEGLSYALRSQGEFVFWRGRGLYLETNQPFFNASTITPDEIFHWNADGTTVTTKEHSGIVQREINRTLLAFFSADLALIEQRFDAQWLHADDHWVLTLTPRQEMVARSVKSARLRGTDFLQSLYLESANGDVTELSFVNVSQAPAPMREQCMQFFRVGASTHCSDLAPAGPQ